MIENQEQLARTTEALAHLRKALAALERDRTAIQPERFALMAEPILDDIHRLRADVDAFLKPSSATPPPTPQGEPADAALRQ